MDSDILIYQNDADQIEVQVRFEGETCWLSQRQMAELFDKDSDTVGLHLKNIYAESELAEPGTTEFFSVVQQEGNRQVTRNVKYYNLDAILSVGYRVSSRRGTLFRQWASQRLKDFLLKGYALNQKRLNELAQVVNIIQKTGISDNLRLEEAKGLLDILGQYTHSFVLLNQFDSNNLKIESLNEKITYEIVYEDAVNAIKELKKGLITRKEAGSLFGNEKDKSFRGILGNVVQTFDGTYLYSSVEEQAANLLYFVIKNHPFSDGNKRIGAFLFVWFLELNRHRFKPDGELKINDNALVALAILVAQSDPSEKEIMIRLIINLIKNP